MNRYATRQASKHTASGLLQCAIANMNKCSLPMLRGTKELIIIILIHGCFCTLSHSHGEDLQVQKQSRVTNLWLVTGVQGDFSISPTKKMDVDILGLGLLLCFQNLLIKKIQYNVCLQSILCLLPKLES